ncbi:MAG: tRNA guanosine(34) transglycosylase Tgt [Chloroflexota bacterium]
MARIGTFEILARSRDGRARAGVLHTAHGPLETPAFMPVGTQASVKSLMPSDLARIRPSCVLANTYHLSVRPGAPRVERLGGVHRMMGWQGPMLTDSGGYQVFSLSALRSLDDNGATFTSPLDGRKRRFTPASVVRRQEQIGADIIMQLDECVGAAVGRDEAERALARTNRWAAQSLRARRRDDQLLFAIVQGGMFPELRSRAVSELAELPFPGFAIGGLSVGEPRALTDGLVDLCAGRLPEDRPRYLMGVGEPDQLQAYAQLGVDMFDCVMPTRLGRSGYAFSPGGRLNLNRPVCRDVCDPIDRGCGCLTCAQYTQSYLHQLLRGGEPLGARLVSVHNVTYLVNLLRRLRQSILDEADEDRSLRR